MRESSLSNLSVIQNSEKEKPGNTTREINPKKVKKRIKTQGNNTQGDKIQKDKNEIRIKPNQTRCL